MKNVQKRKQGGVLVVISISMVAAGLLGMALLATIGGTYQIRLLFDAGSRACYAAQSGLAFLHAKRQLDADYEPDSQAAYTLGNGDQFSFDAQTSSNALVVSVTGIAYPGSYREHRCLKRATFELTNNDNNDPPAGTPTLDEVFVYGTDLTFNGQMLMGNGGTIIIRDGLDSRDVNGGATLAVSTIFFGDDVTITHGRIDIGSPTAPGAIYVDGDLVLTGGKRDLYGDVYVSGDVLLANVNIHGNLYVDGDVTYRWGAPGFGADSHVYYTGTVNAPRNYPTAVLDRTIQQATVPVFEMPDDFVPQLRPDDWYASQGYVNDAELVDDVRIFHSGDYDFRSTGRWRSAENVVIVSKGDISIDIRGNESLSGVLIAPQGSVTLNCKSFDGIVIARDGFDVPSGSSVVTFLELSDFFDSEEEIPLIVEMP